MSLHDNTTYPPVPPNCHTATCIVPPTSPPTALTGANIEGPAAVMGAALVVGLLATIVARWASRYSEVRHG